MKHFAILLSRCRQFSLHKAAASFVLRIISRMLVRFIVQPVHLSQMKMSFVGVLLKTRTRLRLQTFESRARNFKQKIFALNFNHLLSTKMFARFNDLFSFSPGVIQHLVWATATRVGEVRKFCCIALKLLDKLNETCFLIYCFDFPSNSAHGKRSFGPQREVKPGELVGNDNRWTIFKIFPERVSVWYNLIAISCCADDSVDSKQHVFKVKQFEKLSKASNKLLYRKAFAERSKWSL